ncbi:fungal hydrophobin [Panus rudis PR-1116 ss-1]|nr:fungal hydrophobin [Panus rudis PR-1116 ss-1]
MIARIYTTILYVFFALTVLAAATPNPVVARNAVPTTTQPAVTKTITVTAPGPTVTIPADQCTTGPVQCCQSMETAGSKAGSLVLGLLGIVVEGLDVLLGLSCSPISVIGAGGGNCNSNVVCCENNNVGGLISIGCIPVIL